MIATALEPEDTGRRQFLKVFALGLGGMALGISLPSAAAVLDGMASPVTPNDESAVTAWVRITADNQVTIIVSQAEIGQGISTTLPAIIADELGADWEKVKLETAPFAPAYRNPVMHWMFTGNSESTQSFYALMRSTGAAARSMLVQAAAARWGVAPETCNTEASYVVHQPSGRRLSFGEVAADAAKLPVPQQAPLRLASELRLIGRPLPKVDVPAKVDGSAVYGIDFSVPDMLVAAVRTAPTVGGSLKQVDEAALGRMPGVEAVIPVAGGIAVVAKHYWQAKRALLAFPPSFDAGANQDLNSNTLMQAYRDKLEHGPWANAVNTGRVEPRLARAAKVIRADYENPFAAHATMEPMNCTAHVRPDRCEIWAPTQGQEFAHVALKTILGLKDEQVIINRSQAIGGGFGRRLLPDFVIQAALIAKAVGRPVKLIWDREEDFRRDSYRPASVLRLEACLSKGGLPAAIAVKLVSPTILLPVFPPIAAMLKDKGIDPSALEGLMETPYALPQRRVDFHLFSTAIPTSVMRTTGYGPNLFALESFIDELAHAALSDPYRYRQRLLAHNPRTLAVLDKAARMGNWGAPLARGHGRGIAFAEAFGSLIAQVLEVAVDGPAVRVLRVSSAVDCGRVLDPGIASAGIEGGVVFGLAYCKAEVTFKNGQVEQDNFYEYRLPYLSETPVMETAFIDGGGKLGGVGELSPVTVPPALANAIYAATGKRLKAMPISCSGLQFV